MNFGKQLSGLMTKSDNRDILLRSIQSNFFGLEWKNRLKWAKSLLHHTESSNYLLENVSKHPRPLRIIVNHILEV